VQASTSAALPHALRLPAHAFFSINLIKRLGKKKKKKTRAWQAALAGEHLGTKLAFACTPASL